ncbi:hypothetical protein [Tepidimonas charontis]|uniref:HDOD domain-containing protein n=1 Tax=Tepidimonas charontis TaxID=2267262 RepID=A0A554XC66_9BURK|nr:hypothetical protein [Tepidimonas charontis]TSE33442.1 hypothetical protein Tchar_01772 [Tepidimonas charontis]
MIRPSTLATAPPSAAVSSWTRRLLAVAPPPLSPPDVIRILYDEELPTPRLLAILQRDLPLGLAVLLEAQQRLRQGQVESLAHAVGVLGLRGLWRVVERLAAHPFDPRQPAHRLYAEAVATSRLAAHLAAQLAPAGTPETRQRLMWEMQVQTMAEWRLPLAAPDVAQRMAARIAAGERPTHVERDLLGCPLHALNAALAQHFGFVEPDDPRATVWLQARRLAQAARHAWIDAHPPPLPDDVGRWLYRPSTLRSLLHWLAQEAMRSWYSPRTRLLCDALSAHRHWRVGDVVAATRRAALAASHEMLTRGVVVAPAARLFWAPWVRPRRGPGADATAAAAPASAGVHTGGPAAARHPTPGSTARPLIERFAADCQRGRHPDVGAFFRAFQHALDEGLGLRRCALFLKTTQAAQLVCYMAHGFGGSIVPRQTTVALQGEHVLARLFAQPGAFLLAEPARVAHLRTRLPASLQRALLPSGAMWGTVQVRQRAVGVLWADTGSADAPVDTTQYAGFKRLMHHFGPGLTRLMQLRRAAFTATRPPDEH